MNQNQTKQQKIRVVRFGGTQPFSPKLFLPGIYGFYGSSKNGPENYEPINTWGFLSCQVTLEVPITYDGIAYYSVESFYFAMKTTDKTKRKKIAQKNLNVSSAAVKGISKSIQPRKNWEILKWEVLLYALRRKFQIKRFRAALLKTENLYIEESNWWGDTYYGVSHETQRGFNILGHMLMHVRNEIRNNLDPDSNPFIYKFVPEENPEDYTELIIP